MTQPRFNILLDRPDIRDKAIECFRTPVIIHGRDLRILWITKKAPAGVKQLRGKHNKYLFENPYTIPMNGLQLRALRMGIEQLPEFTDFYKKF